MAKNDEDDDGAGDTEEERNEKDASSEQEERTTEEPPASTARATPASTARARARAAQPRPPAPRASAGLERPPVQLDVSDVRGNTPEERFTRILDRLNLKDNVRKFAEEYWRDTPAIQNPYALFDFLSKLPGIGGGSMANMIVSYVYGGPNPYTAGVPPFAQPAAGYPSFPGNPYAMQFPQAPAREEAPPREQSIEEETQDMVRGMLASANAAMRVRMMMQAIGPAFGSSNSVDLVPRPRVDENGQPVVDSRGVPVVDWVPSSQRAAQVSDMMQRAERGESVDPTKLASLMVDMFKTGVSVAAPAAGGGSDPTALMQMQAQVHQANIETLRTQFAATEKLFETERQQFLRQIDQMSPERQAEQLKKLKESGLLGTDNLETLRLNLKVHMWEVDREDARARAQGEAAVRGEEARRGREEFHDLVLLGKDALEKALQPITVAVGDGLRERVAGRGSPPPAPAAAPPPAAAPLNYAGMSPDQRARARAKLQQVRAELEQHEAELNATESGSPPPAAPPAEEPYGA